MATRYTVGCGVALWALSQAAAAQGCVEVAPFKSVFLVFAEEQAESLVSGFGHIFVCLPNLPTSSVQDLLAAPAVNFGADTSRLGQGMWVGQYKLQPATSS